MPADRFYLDELLCRGAIVSLAGVEYHHLSHVMRISIGEEVELVNGRGALAIAKLLSANKQEARLEILSVQTTSRPIQQIILAIPLLRYNKLELIVEKGTELGASAFWFYVADFSEKIKLSAHQSERLRFLAISALKQSGRLFLPEFQFLPSLETIHEFILFGDTQSGAPKMKEIELQETIIFVTGPEKGYSKRELELLQKKGKGVTLNPHILRAETAPLAAMSILAIYRM
jgi:16S rRNA (uracil1498-N3)-methyltransferase